MNVARTKLPAHGRANWSPSPAVDTGAKIRTLLGTFTTDDRANWRTETVSWTAELRRSKNGRHWFLAVFKAGVYRRRYDSTGWHAATDRKRIRQLRSYQLPLVA